MANNMNSDFVENTGLNKHNSFPHLIQSIRPNLEKELDLYEHLKYYSDAEFINMFNQIHNEITIMNLNCYISTCIFSVTYCYINYNT